MSRWDGRDRSAQQPAWEAAEGARFVAETIGDESDDLVAEWKRAIDEQRAWLSDNPEPRARPISADLSAGPTRADRPRPEDGDPTGATTPADQADWTRARQMLDRGELCVAPVLGRNSGGVVVGFGALRGFVPATRLVGFPRRAPLAARERFLESRVGETLTLAVIEVDPANGRLVLSESDGVRRQRDRQRDRLLRELQAGQVCRGVVTRLCDFGAFVDLGGADGLVHVSELAWRRVAHPRDVLHVGQEVEVQVLRLDPAQRHIGLSLKRMQPNPWLTVAERFREGQIVRGVITRVMDYGAFAQVDGGIEGLIHLSELAEGNFMHPRNVVSEGETVDLVVIQVEPVRQRLGLSLRRVAQSKAAVSGNAES